MAKRVEVEFEGKLVPAEQLDFTATSSEPWAEYVLEDGTTIRLKAVLASVFRVLDRYKPDGEPVYGFAIGNLPVLSIPPELKKVPQKENEIVEG